MIDIVDAPDRIEALLPELEPMMGSGLVTLKRVRAVRYGEEKGLG